LYGIQAITANNGWSMAIVGAMIVFSGLVVLSLTIAQLHRIIAFFENRKKPTPDSESPEILVTSTVPDQFPVNIDEAVELYKPLIEQLGETFKLNDLYTISREKNFPAPHHGIKLLRQEKFLLPLGGGDFTWNKRQ